MAPVETKAFWSFFSKKDCLLPLLAYTVLSCTRMPQIVITGRFWAEEGRVFFRNAWDQPPLQALFTSYGGYLNLPANAAALAARWLMPLELAPYLTIGVALAIQLLAPVLLLTARDGWLRPAWVRVGCLALLLVSPQVGEGLLQTLHCQFQLTLCCGLLLALDIPPGRAARLRLILLFFAPLAGPVPFVLIPLFLIRALTDRARGRLLQATALAAGSAIQFLLFFHAVAGRGYALHPVMGLCAVTIHYLDVPLFGLAHAEATGKLIRAKLQQGFVPKQATLLPFAVFLPWLLATLAREAARPAFWLLAAAGAIAAATHVGAIGGARAMLDVLGGERYVFVPQTLLGLSVLALAATYTGWARAAFCCVVVWLLAVGAYAYADPWDVIATGPSWRAEVAAWRADPRHVLQIWPRGWTMTLAARK